MPIPRRTGSTALTALDATAAAARAGRTRAAAGSDVHAGAFSTALLPGEIIAAVRVPRLSADARWGYYKVCRKPGEFAACDRRRARDPERGRRRAVIGATGRHAVVVADGAAR